MSLHYLGKFKIRNFALSANVKQVSNVTFYHLSNRYLSDVMKISAKINVMQPPQPFYGPFSRTTRVSRCQKRTSGLYGARED